MPSHRKDPFVSPRDSHQSSPSRHAQAAAPSSCRESKPVEVPEQDHFKCITTEEILALAGENPTSPPPDQSEEVPGFSPLQLSPASSASSALSAPPQTPPLPDYEEVIDNVAEPIDASQEVAASQVEKPTCSEKPLPGLTYHETASGGFPAASETEDWEKNSRPIMTQVAQQTNEGSGIGISEEELKNVRANLDAFIAKCQPNLPPPLRSNTNYSFPMFTGGQSHQKLAEPIANPFATLGQDKGILQSIEGMTGSKHTGATDANEGDGKGKANWWTADKHENWNSSDARMDNTPSSQPASSNLFGNATSSSGNASSGTLFGGNQAQASSAPASNSLFSRVSAPNSSASQTNSSPFGGTATSSGGMGGGLFGGAAASSAGQSSSLFGASNAQSSQPSGNSLFANVGQTSQSGTSGGLFGTNTANATTSAQSGGSLFPTSGTSSSSAQPSNSLFAPKTQAQNSGGLFGATNQTTQPSGGGLFGGSNQTSQPAGGGLFGNTNQANQATNTGLFGNASQPSQQAGGSLFGNTNQSSQQAGPGLFGNAGGSQTLGANTQQQHPSQQSAQTNGQVSKNGEAPRAALFEDLLERGRKRRDVGGSENAQLPSLQLGLGDISSKIKGLGNTKPDFSASRAHDSRAHYLLAASGIQQGATKKDLEALANETAAVQSQLPPQDDPRIENYMASMHAKTLREMMDEAMEQSKRDFDDFLEDNLQINWDYQRKRVYEHLGLIKPGDQEDQQSDRMDSSSLGPRGAFGRSSRRSRAPDASARGSMRGSMQDSPMSKSVLGGSVGRGSMLRHSMFKDVEERASEAGAPALDSEPYQRTTMERYCNKVRDLNVARMEETVFPVIEQFARVELDNGSDTPKHIINAYQALRNIVKENSNVERLSHEGAIRERQYLQDYISDNPNAGSSVRLRQQILDGSRKYLEDNFFNRVQDLVDKNPQEASIGGMPTKASIIRGYLRIRESSRDLLPEDQEPQRGEAGEPIWATIFFLIRSGLIDEAAHYVENNERVIKTYDRSFPQYIASYASQGRNMPYNLRSRMTREYQQRLSNPAKVNDPYRMACYKVLGRCDLSHPRLDIPHPDVEDVIWLYFALAREANRAEETAGDTMGLENVQTIVGDIKERIFAANQDQSDGAYATCFLLQILAGTFEQAVAYLYQFNQVAAVHFAIALDFYGLLRVSDPLLDMDLLTYTTRQQPQVNFGRLLGYYTQSFRLARPEAAADYLVLIAMNADLPGELGQKMAHVSHEALKELTLETREFPLLIGDIRNDGRRIRGVIETRLSLIAKGAADPAEFLRTLTIQAAQVADDAGRVNDAALLYHLAEEYDSVVTVVNRALSDALSIDIAAEPMRLQPLKPRAKPDDPPKPQDNMSSLSLVAVDDPATLTQNMLSLYNTHALYFSRISEVNRQSAALLLRMWEVRSRIASHRWAEAIDTLGLMDLLPMRAAGNISAIRASAAKLNQQPPVVARNVGNLLVWAIGACGEQRRILMQGGFDVGGHGRETEKELRQCARDLMVFAGLVRYRIGGDVYEVLARAGEGME
ncbi:MAG: hypothetical protein Q9162_003529 [Coniocarpon cinnabarinum]